MWDPGGRIWLVRQRTLNNRSAPRDGTRWTRGDFIAALALYKTPGVYPDMDHPKVVELAKLMGRTPSAVALSLANFRAIESEGRSGLSHYPTKAKALWQEYHGREIELATDASKIRNAYASQV